ncbi:MAG: hypothetical protein M3P08_20115, partial [Thermoproteota archaeon]|nr:hypothetical protein [Thermoproteota archaeon]
MMMLAGSHESWAIPYFVLVSSANVPVLSYSVRDYNSISDASSTETYLTNDQRSIYKPIRITRGNILFRAKEAYKREGLYHTIRVGAITFLDHIGVWYYKLFKSSETFEFQGNTYHYLFH